MGVCHMVPCSGEAGAGRYADNLFPLRPPLPDAIIDRSQPPAFLQGAVHQPINRGDNAHEITSPCGQQHVYRLLLSGRAGSQLLHRGRLGEDSLRHGLLKHFHQKRTGHGNRPGSDHPHRLVPRTQRPHRRAESPGGALRPFPNPSHRPPALLRAQMGPRGLHRRAF